MAVALFPWRTGSPQPWPPTHSLPGVGQQRPRSPHRGCPGARKRGWKGAQAAGTQERAREGKHSSSPRTHDAPRLQCRFAQATGPSSCSPRTPAPAQPRVLRDCPWGTRKHGVSAHGPAGGAAWPPWPPASRALRLPHSLSAPVPAPFPHPTYRHILTTSPQCSAGSPRLPGGHRGLSSGGLPLPPPTHIHTHSPSLNTMGTQAQSPWAQHTGDFPPENKAEENRDWGVARSCRAVTAHGYEVSVWGDGMLWNYIVVMMCMCQMSLYILGFVYSTTITPPQATGSRARWRIQCQLPISQGTGTVPSRQTHATLG